MSFHLRGYLPNPAAPYTRDVVLGDGAGVVDEDLNLLRALLVELPWILRVPEDRAYVVVIRCVSFGVLSRHTDCFRRSGYHTSPSDPVQHVTVSVVTRPDSDLYVTIHLYRDPFTNVSPIRHRHTVRLTRVVRSTLFITRTCGTPSSLVPSWVS